MTKEKRKSLSAWITQIYAKQEQKKKQKNSNLIEKKLMPGKAFIDTNILIYSYWEDETLKQNIANDIENAVLEIDTVLSVVNFDLTTQIKAIRLKDRYRLQFYDALFTVAQQLSFQLPITAATLLSDINW